MDYDEILTDSGTFQAFLDQMVETGLPDQSRRAFATWLETTVGDLQSAVEELKERTPEEVPVVEGPYFLPSKEAAQARAAQLRRDPRVRDTLVQMEAYNGWVVVVYPAFCDLSDLVGIAEVQDGQKRQIPGGKALPDRLPTAPDNGGKAGRAGDGKAQGGAAPTKGVTARVWEIAAEVTAAKGGMIDRAAIVNACKAVGINEATAATQYSKWKKAKGV